MENLFNLQRILFFSSHSKEIYPEAYIIYGSDANSMFIALVNQLMVHGFPVLLFIQTWNHHGYDRKLQPKQHRG